MVKVKVKKEWFDKYVFNHHPELKEIIENHNYIGEYLYEVNIQKGGKYGVRVVFRDDRFKRGKFCFTPTEGNYQMIEEV